MELDLTISNPNSSGQGKCDAHAAHPLHKTTVDAGYLYSHSVFVGNASGKGKTLWHCYKKGEHCVSFPEGDMVIPHWRTKTSTASGNEWLCEGKEALRRHLARKNHRYFSK